MSIESGMIVITGIAIAYRGKGTDDTSQLIVNVQSSL